MDSGFSFLFLFELPLYTNFSTFGYACRLLSRRDIEVVVEHGAAFLFKNGDVSVRRMRSFLGNIESNVRALSMAYSFLYAKRLTKI
jgi:hypothetical protein